MLRYKNTDANFSSGESSKTKALVEERMEIAIGQRPSVNPGNEKCSE